MVDETRKVYKKPKGNRLREEDKEQRRVQQRGAVESSAEAPSLQREGRPEPGNAGHGGVRTPPQEVRVAGNKSWLRPRPQRKLVISQADLKKFRGF